MYFLQIVVGNETLYLSKALGISGSGVEELHNILEMLILVWSKVFQRNLG